MNEVLISIHNSDTECVKTRLLPSKEWTVTANGLLWGNNSGGCIKCNNTDNKTDTGGDCQRDELQPHITT